MKSRVKQSVMQMIAAALIKSSAYWAQQWPRQPIVLRVPVDQWRASPVGLATVACQLMKSASADVYVTSHIKSEVDDLCRCFIAEFVFVSPDLLQ